MFRNWPTKSSNCSKPSRATHRYDSRRLGVSGRAEWVSSIESLAWMRLTTGGIAWFWIGTHADYDKLLG